jgi:hypothetical protein
MRTGNVIFSAVQFLVVVLILCIGGFLVILPNSPVVQYRLAEFFALGSDLFLPVGLMITGFGLILLFGFYAMYRQRFFSCKMNKQEVRVEISLLNDLIQTYWKSRFSDPALVAEVLVHPDNKLELIVELPPGSPQERHLNELEKQIGDLLSRHLGYDQEFFMTFITK